MASKEDEDGALEVQGSEVSLAKQQGLFGSSGIELTEEELISSATVKFLRHINSNNENEITKLRSFEGQFYDKRQDCEVLKKEKELLNEQLSSKKDIENIQKVMITFGSLILGSMKLMASVEWYVLTILAITSVGLIVGGMFPMLKLGGKK